MPNSPLHVTIYPPIYNLAVYKASLKELRAEWNHDPKFQYEDLADKALSDGDKLVEHCEFLASKLSVKVRS